MDISAHPTNPQSIQDDHLPLNRRVSSRSSALAGRWTRAGNHISLSLPRTLRLTQKDPVLPPRWSLVLVQHFKHGSKHTSRAGWLFGGLALSHFMYIFDAALIMMIVRYSVWALVQACISTNLRLFLFSTFSLLFSGAYRYQPRWMTIALYHIDDTLYICMSNMNLTSEWTQV